ncbi:ornithine cyclodeaminase family protein [Phocicoccus pinnipedialis]|uniref:L-lysine cyclodeaminase n=1 Tax=Phocicoccus pinnipedialis TaxID=110845 RepID=A0A6V7R4E7_9BACL|nr:ornithine cyclodeaminase family protein [Jeotgalicoccus pinnipedialis]MBP1939687.1 ornithine cyclodeaminase [Jeotgalicoccus pinnipedialis]CAD2072309.1 L-lysine cyclodeaminase [Jeotgalicoccus pinnipedialis]
MIIFTEEEVFNYHMADAIKDIKRTLMRQNNGKIVNRKHVMMPVGDSNMIMNFPALDIEQGLTSTKIMSIKDGVSKAHSILTDTDSGEVIANVAASYLTELRTGAMSGIATDMLARKDASVLGVIGTGRMAVQQVFGVLSVRDIEKIILFNHHPEKAEYFKDKIRGLTVTCDIEIASNVNTLTKACDIIITATPSREAVFDDTYLKEGVHINGIGAFMPSTKELNVDTIGRAKYVVVDYKKGVESSAGGFIEAVKQDKFKFENMIQLNDAIEMSFDRNEKDITIFKSIGASLYDMAVAIGAYEKLK